MTALMAVLVADPEWVANVECPNCYRQADVISDAGTELAVCGCGWEAPSHPSPETRAGECPACLEELIHTDMHDVTFVRCSECRWRKEAA